jgi:aminopeptidase N
VDYFEQTFGPYPFAEFDVVETANIAGGIEYPGLITMPIQNYGQIGGFFQWATVHEVAHQWWYSLVGNDQQDEPWLDEALTQYSTALYYEFRADWPVAVDEMFVSTYDAIRDTELDDLIDRPVAAYSEANYGPVVYYKGPLFFDALRQELGDETFFALLQDYFTTYRYRESSQAELRDLIDQAAGMDMSPLYQQWLGE